MKTRIEKDDDKDWSRFEDKNNEPGREKHGVWMKIENEEVIKTDRS